MTLQSDPRDVRPGPGRRPPVPTTPDSSHHRTELRPRLRELLSARSAAERLDVLTAARIPCAPINDVRGGGELADRDAVLAWLDARPQRA